ncbi:65-kDa microtubule-associated protein 3-like [Cucurbita moschata]|uniref:65-kDa microtubule-associated protein 3-like n=1 Tax=Cucurbita moschata TaxID=3662 RepID=A0A6J1E4B1_CUCMO|nr:65-kDa microtubule-associated protein 3-like [Cucurbita moschata]
MSVTQNDPLLQVETTCGSLLYELQIIWDEVGECEAERDRMLLELERECLEVYRRKVDQANHSRAHLRQAIADSEAQLAAICSALGEPPVHIRQSDQKAVSLKDELEQILPQLDEMRKRKSERSSQFLEVLDEIRKISDELNGYEHSVSKILLDETDLSLKKLDELNRQLHALQQEKSDRMKLVYTHMRALDSLCLVLGMDSKQIAIEVHPTLGDFEAPTNITINTIEKLAAMIEKLREIKLQRMQKLQDLVHTLLDLWNLMDTPAEEQQMFQNITCNIAALEHEIIEPDALSVDVITYVEAEVSRLEELKSSRMKELVLKKRLELEEMCMKLHMLPAEDSAIEYVIDAIDCGTLDPACVLEQIENQILKVKEEAFDRNEILEKVDRWLAACEEECWLEEYNRDENRYNAGRGAHLTLKRAEKARALVNKLPGMVNALTSKTMSWEKERGIEFTYDGVRLLSMLEEYKILRQEKEQELRRQRDQKKLQGQLMAEQEALYGSKPSPSKPQSVKKGPRMSTGGAGAGAGAGSRRFSLGGALLQTPKPDPHKGLRPGRKSDRGHQNNQTFHLDEGFVEALSAGRRGLDVPGLPVKKHSSSVDASEAESPMVVRKPFAPVPIAGALFSNSMNSSNSLNDLNEKLQKVNLSSKTPIKTISISEEDIRTPKMMPIPVPSTPSTVSVPMQTAITPAPPRPIDLTARISEDISEVIEYSFEERRAGFALPKPPLLIKSMIQV